MNRPVPPNRPAAPPEARNSRFGSATGQGSLYDRHAPIPVPEEVIEKDTDSAWALFQESVMAHDNPPTVRDAQGLEPSGDFAPTAFGESMPPDAKHVGGFDATDIAPLKP
jgi:hypothetical protein